MNVPIAALQPSGCFLALSHHICYLHGSCSQKKVVTQGNLFTDLCLALKQGALKHVKSGKQTVSLFCGTFSLWICKGVLWEDSSLLHSWVWLLAYRNATHVWKRAFFKVHSLARFRLNPEGGRQQKGGGGAARLMYTACSIS
jgi:hypothetical protein